MKQKLEPVADLPHVLIYKPFQHAEMVALCGSTKWDLKSKVWFEKAIHHGSLFICVSKIDKKRRWVFQPSTDTWIDAEDATIDITSSSTLADELEAISFVLTTSLRHPKQGGIGSVH